MILTQWNWIYPHRIAQHLVGIKVHLYCAKANVKANICLLSLIAGQCEHWVAFSMNPFGSDVAFASI